jgi:hypothetical protein
MQLLWQKRGALSGKNISMEVIILGSLEEASPVAICLADCSKN